MEGSDPPIAPPSRRRRTMLLGAAGVLVAAAVPIGLYARAVSKKQDAVDAKGLAQQAYAALREGRIADAVALAKSARSKDLHSREALTAWLHATGVDLMEGSADGGRAVGFVAEARRAGLRGTELAFATVAAAVAMKNDRFARRLVDQHVEQQVASDAFYELAAGAALDLDCDPEAAAERFEASASMWIDAPLPRLRRARSLAFADRFDEARDEIESMSFQGVDAAVLLQAIDRIADPSVGYGYVDAMAIADLPRSLRPVGQALLATNDPTQFGIEAALADLDTPLAGLMCATLMVQASDYAAAERALAAARAMRSELSDVTEQEVRLALLRGDLVKAKDIADGSGNTELIALVSAIGAYEQGSLASLDRAVEQAETAALSPWTLASAAEGMMGRGERPGADLLDEAMQMKEPWADVMIVDLALKLEDFDTAEAIMRGWSERSAARDLRRARLRERRGPEHKP